MRVATIKDKQRVVEIISHSFDQNKSVNYVVPQDSKRRKRIKKLIEYSFNKGLLYGKVLISDNEKAACILLFSGNKKLSLKGVIKNLFLIFNVIGVNKLKDVIKREKTLKSYHPNNAFYHLWYIGVEPNYQGKGIGSKLLKEILETFSDKPIYLETSVPKNLKWYQSFGFEIIEELKLDYDLYILKKK